MSSYNPARDIPDLNGKVFFITGGTNGLGKRTILDLAKHSPAHIYFTGRNAQSAKSVVQEAKPVPTTFIECDQSDLASVQKAAHQFLSSSSRLDALICNGGVMATAPRLTKDGYENQFGINHVAHAAFVKLLLPTLEKTKDARVLFVTSLGFQNPFPGGIDFEGVKTVQDEGPFAKWTRYGQSKLANVLSASELAKRYPGILSVSLHPGAVKTDIIGTLSQEDQDLVYASNEVVREEYEGSYNICWCATSDEAKSGMFYMPDGVSGQSLMTEDSKDEKLAAKLWDWTQDELKKID